jgi:hypothetical protein
MSRYESVDATGSVSSMVPLLNWAGEVLTKRPSSSATWATDWRNDGVNSVMFYFSLNGDYWKGIKDAIQLKLGALGRS